ncbi:MAG: hypothetical protein KBG09_08830, partial [Syntrophobacterales bacterium]|nr:hypothetical protein [Syntrophobacterales bacterium]
NCWTLVQFLFRGSLSIDASFDQKKVVKSLSNDILLVISAKKYLYFERGKSSCYFLGANISDTKSYQ